VNATAPDLEMAHEQRKQVPKRTVRS
jgi:hypothetical protein